PLTWTGAANSEWDLSSQNWTNTSTHALDYYSQGDTVLFSDSGLPGNVDLPQAISPSSVTVNANANYTFSSGNAGGSLFGPMSLTKGGAGTLILDVPSTYTGPTLISGGTLQVGNGDVGASIGTG